MHARTPEKSHGRLRDGAFTLVEIVVSISVLSIVMGALMSTMIMASHAIPDTDDPGLTSTDINATFERITADAMVATEISISGDVLTLTVPDRTGDDTPEVIVYYLATPDTLPSEFLVSVNTGTPRILLDRALAFSVSVVSFDGRYRLLIVELATARGTVHRISIDLLARPEVS